MRLVHYYDLAFQPDMLTARHDDGTEIRLTRQERALLLRLVRQPNMLVTRAQLLDALGDESDSFGERNIDYLVNRLRKRLGDDARQPRFIATQYGEGYIWLAEPVRQEPLAAFLLIGPAYGLSSRDTLAPMLLEQLASGLRRQISADKPVLCRPSWRPARDSDDDVAFNLEVAAHTEGERLHLALVLRDGRSQIALQSFRLTLERKSADRPMETFADTLIEALWTHAALPGPEAPLPSSNPAHLRMHDAGAMLTGSAVSWRESDKRLRAALRGTPDDPRLKILLALNLYARLIQNIAEIATGPLTAAEWIALEDEIEALALRALDTAGDDPLLLLGLAKVLHFIDRGYLDLAARLTDQAFAAGTAFSAVFAMKGQLAAARGDIDEATGFYDKAIEISGTGSQFHVYLLVLKATGLMATGQRKALDHLLVELNAKSPMTSAVLGPYFVSPRSKTLPDHLEQRFVGMGPDMGRNYLFHLDRTSARHFESDLHRRNVLSGFATHLQRCHGTAAIPPELSFLLT